MAALLYCSIERIGALELVKKAMCIVNILSLEAGSLKYTPSLPAGNNRIKKQDVYYYMKSITTAIDNKDFNLPSG